ncbi:MAG: agmatine deiminase family protein [Methanobacteriota archaeon]|nr:MAG: agmatine deiminase family protein [Euryarchaeota archaeon]
MITHKLAFFPVIIDRQIVTRYGDRTAMNDHSTPVDDGLSMPAERSPHAGCLVSWPCSENTWSGYFAEAKAAYSAIIEAISDFEPVVVLSDPTTFTEARRAVGKRAHVV